MPGMHGRDLASAIRGQHPTIKCLFMSGYTADVIAHHGVLQDDVQFIQKPFSSVGLLNKVRAALDAPG
jgi:FixJ family two-component response regulator